MKQPKLNAESKTIVEDLTHEFGHIPMTPMELITDFLEEHDYWIRRIKITKYGSTKWSLFYVNYCGVTNYPLEYPMALSEAGELYISKAPNSKDGLRLNIHDRDSLDKLSQVLEWNKAHHRTYNKN